MSTESAHVDDTSLIYNWGITHVEPLTRRETANHEEMPLCIDMTHVYWEHGQKLRTDGRQACA